MYIFMYVCIFICVYRRFCQLHFMLRWSNQNSVNMKMRDLMVFILTKTVKTCDVRVWNEQMSASICLFTSYAHVLILSFFRIVLLRLGNSPPCVHISSEFLPIFRRSQAYCVYAKACKNALLYFLPTFIEAVDILRNNI